MAQGEVYGPHYRWVRQSGSCLLTGSPGHTCSGPIDAHHVITVGNGGIDAANVVRLCRAAHRWNELAVHVMGRDSFEAYWKVDLSHEAWLLWLQSPHGPGEGKEASHVDETMHAFTHQPDHGRVPSGKRPPGRGSQGGAEC